MNIDRRHFLGLVAAGTAVALARPSRAAATDNVELEEITVGELQEGMRAGRLTSRSIAEGYLQRIDSIDKRGPAINAILELNPDALAIAEERDRERRAGPVRAAVGVGTETDGSVVCPSSASGLVGIKPTLGLLGGAGIVPIAHSQDTAGPMCRTVADAAILLGVLAGKDYAGALDRNGLRGARI